MAYRYVCLAVSLTRPPSLSLSLKRKTLAYTRVFEGREGPSEEAERWSKGFCHNGGSDFVFTLYPYGKKA
jgi:hypothetical protein